MTNKIPLEIRTKSGDFIKGNLFNFSPLSYDEELKDNNDFLEKYIKSENCYIFVEYKQFFNKKIRIICKDSIESITLYRTK